MGRRSPILGYNHNVRYRGVAFHVQTEDSGPVNPHIFSHMFHGGTIVSTRKLVYDPSADDGVIKSLMQAQHKAVMKALRRGLFDDKIDFNLRGTPGLLPRGSSEPVVEETGIGSAQITKPSAAAEQEAMDFDTGAGGPHIELTAEHEPSQPEIQVTQPQPEGRRGGPADAVPPFPPPSPDAPPIQSSVKRRTSTPPPMSAASLPPISHRAHPSAAAARGAGLPKPGSPGARPATAVPPDIGQNEVSAAFDQITAQDDVAEIHSPAPGSAPAPPGAIAGERPGEYVQKRGDRPMRDDVRTGRIPTDASGTGSGLKRAGGERSSQSGFDGKPRSQSGFDGKPRSQSGFATAKPKSNPGFATAKPKSNPGFTGSPQGRAGADPSRGSGSRAAVQGATSRADPAGRSSATPPPVPQRGVPARGAPEHPIPRVRTPTSPRPFAASPQRTGQVTQPQRARSSSGGGGVVMSRPAVIIGGRSSNPTPAPLVGSRGAQVPGPPGARVRRAREESGRGVFGQDLISEKSLDEVILAYLSEDAAED